MTQHDAAPRTFPIAGLACETDEMMTTEAGFIFKVVAGSDKIKSYTDPSGSEETYALELLQPYFVICEDGDHYKITNQQADTVAQDFSKFLLHFFCFHLRCP